jgi:hypothetical protein
MKNPPPKQLHFEGLGEISLIRSARRSISIQVLADGQVVVRAPLRLPAGYLERLLAEKTAWIRQKQAQAGEKRLSGLGKAPGKRRFESGQPFPFLGQDYPLEIVERQAAPLRLEGGFRLRRAALGQAAEAFEAWYREQARALFTRRLSELAARHGFQFSRMRLSSARTRWGSCSSRGTISLNWRLVLAPPEIVDYVILHELAHLRTPNHSKDFWRLVESLCPEYPARRKWLKANTARLSWP